MITKFSEIKNMAVFKDFHWDNSVLKNDKVLCFEKVNVLYGRNYSGKTTLSRIVRAFETGTLSEKYGTPRFSIQLSDGSSVSESDYPNQALLARVFNEDFIKDNLKFVVDPDSDIVPFAVLGEDNARIEVEIRSLYDKLGILDNDKSSGMYLQLHNGTEALKKAEHELDDAKARLEKQKNAKATGKATGIKYQFSRFNQQNYSIRDLNRDIEFVCSKSFIVPSDANIQLYETALIEQRL